jgi:hypothetical protein
MLAVVLGAALMLGAIRGAEENPFVFIAGCDNTVTCFEFNSATGEMKELSKSDCGKNPTYLAIHPSRKYLYAANGTKPERSPAIRSIPRRQAHANERVSSAATAVPHRRSSRWQMGFHRQLRAATSASHRSK